MIRIKTLLSMSRGNADWITTLGDLPPMSCDVAVAALYLALAPSSMDAASLRPPTLVIAAPSGARGLAAEPLYATIVRQAARLKQTVDQLARQDDASAPIRLKPGVEALSALDMKAHLDLAARGADGDLKCILKGISVDLGVRLARLAEAADKTARHSALVEMSYLLRDNIEVFTAPPAPPV